MASSSSSSASVTTDDSSTKQRRTKRQHALEELLSSERFYASDMALVRDVFMPLAVGQPIDMVSTSSIATSPQADPPMTVEDARTIFGNIADVAAFTDNFCDALQVALDQDNIGELFLQAIPDMEPPYKLYISRHDTASTHLQSLPITPALTAYKEQTRAISAPVSNAWDLHSMLIKPVQRLLKYPLLLATILEETPKDHPDRENVRLARDAMQEVAHRVNEERRRTEVVKDVLKRTNKDLLVRIKTISRKRPPPPDSDESLHVVKLQAHLMRIQSFANQLAQNVMEWSHSAAATTTSLHRFAMSFSRVLGLSTETPSDAFGAFLIIVTEELLPLGSSLSQSLTRSILQPLTQLLNTLQSPFRLLDTLQETLLPLHTHLIHMPLSQKNRPPSDLLKASAEYLALRAKLAEELPALGAIAERVLAGCILRLARVQEVYWYEVRKSWGELWQQLCLEGDDLLSGDTERIWWGRFEEVDAVLKTYSTLRQPKRIPPRRSTSTHSLPHVSSPLPLTPSSASLRSRATKSSTEYEFENIGYDYFSASRQADSMVHIEMPISPINSVNAPVSPSPHKARTRPGTPTPSIKRKSSTASKQRGEKDKLRPLYVVHGVYPFSPPLHDYSYESYSLLEIPGQGEMYEVLKECGHPREHESRGLRLVMDDIDAPDTLLLVRRGIGGGYKAETGWALASFVEPVP